MYRWGRAEYVLSTSVTCCGYWLLLVCRDMALRCFVFSPDEGTSDVIRQVLSELDVEGESCSEAATAAEKIAKESFQLVVVDWDQADATSMLSAARERKAADRPLILAIVSDDASVPKALQSGANSILRRPILVNQVKDTLTTARDLLRARLESKSAAQATAAAASATSTLTANAEPAENALRNREFLSATPPASGTQFETESEPVSSSEDSAAESVRPLRDLEPLTTSVPEMPPPPDEPRTLEELLKARGVKKQAAPVSSQAGAPGKPDMLGYDQAPSYSSAAAPALAKEQKKEPALFSYVTGESEEPKNAAPSRFRLAKKTIIFAASLAGFAIALAPQAPWHPALKTLWSKGQHSLHAWLNPQPVTTPVAPTAHEDFSRAGDEYKLPVAETIPDATTDPSKINVVPVVDPTAKKPNGDASQDQTPATDQQTSAPADGSQAPAVQNPVSQPQPTTPAATQPAVLSGPPITVAPAPATLPASGAPTISASSQTSTVTYTPVTPTPAPPKSQPAPYVPPQAPKVPSSLKSQMATMVPDASGNKAPEAALPSIEPVAVPEATERALITDQPLIVVPAAAGNQHGTVILQVLIGRDGAVQDAKFFQGSLVFARAAIDGVKQWKFKPYFVNGRPVSVQTTLAVKFPAQ